ncbi:transcription antitermination factor NusB [Acidicapsa dinghuensis]|uniref:Transcription antitermination factor NusB n=1 Tax=Acidicapsa dinghuensis TaxID=2218256 RepID=A0ABW1ER88_9BACT|nr:transcription antitermination factor NusB [Acidicapsa dinghuensis]
MAASKAAISPARREAFRILFEVERSGAHADDLLRSSRVDALSVADRGLCTALVLGVLRWQIRLDGMMRPLLAKPNVRLDIEVQTALRMGAFQLLFLERVPTHAAINESVEICKASGHSFAARMVNAVLRKAATWPKLSAWRLPGNLDAKALAEATAHPAWMVERWARFYGMVAAREICGHGQEQPDLVVRVVGRETEGDLTQKGIQLAAGGLLTAARTVIEGSLSAATLTDAAVRIQDEGSQLIGELAAAAVESPERILDCCAAPGGKTLILAERWPLAAITALELHPERCEALRRRVQADAEAAPEVYGWIAVVHGDAAGLNDAGLSVAGLDTDGVLEGPLDGFDLILVDVPCSGTGTLGRNPEIRHRLGAADLVRHHEQQCEILKSVLTYAARVTEPGKRVRVVYSTCSLEPEENQDVVAEVLSQVEGWRQVSLSEPISRMSELGRLTGTGREAIVQSLTAEGAMLLLPGMSVAGTGRKLETDGFFAALMERVV